MIKLTPIAKHTKGADPSPPLQPDQEWANALTHGIAAAATMLAGGSLMLHASGKSTGFVIACGVYITSVLGTFVFSTLSHTIRTQPLLNTMRAWDQAMIYTMIAGTYTPLVYCYIDDPLRVWILTAMWVAAGLGFASKVALRHRVNASGTISYLLLGYLPAIPLAVQVPWNIGAMMVLGGMWYTIGVPMLVHDGRLRYLHAGWHMSVVVAASIHFVGITMTLGSV